MLIIFVVLFAFYLVPTYIGSRCQGEMIKTLSSELCLQTKTTVINIWQK